MGKSGNIKDKVDRQLLHEYLWNHRVRGDFVPFTSKELAEKLGISVFQMSRIYGEMKDVGRVEKVGTRYRVFDPSVFAWNTKH